MTWALSSLSICGVKGVLDRAGEFKLSPKGGKPRSIAIFGRNGQGKSGYADAVEYLFSTDGEVEHLGKGGADSEQGGKHAIPHVLARERGITSEIKAEFVELGTNKKFSVRRSVVTGRLDSRPPELDALVSRAPAHRILRQHDLRRFVVDMPPGEKFNEFARWIGLERATIILSHLTTTERTLKETDVDREIAERVKSIDIHTSGAIKSYDLAAILKWCREEVNKYTGQELSVHTPSDIENAVQALRSHREQVVLQSQTAQAYAAKNDLEKAAGEFVAKEGLLNSFEIIVSKSLEAEQARDEAQTKASQSVFQEVWESANKVIKREIPEICPVCQTPWVNTAVGSIENVIVTLQSSLDSLSQFRMADTLYGQQREHLKDALQRLEQSLAKLEGSAKVLTLTQVLDETIRLKSLCAELRQSTQKLQELKLPFSKLIADCSVLATQKIPRILAEQKLESSSTSVQPIDTSISHLEGLRDTVSRLEALKKQQRAIRTVEQEFSEVAATIREGIRALAENAVNAMRTDVEKIYKQIHPGEAVPNVFIDLDTVKKALMVRISFYSPYRRVPPGGYLSEAQINTLGLALFLSSVRLFNAEFPFIFLDDIVSSYDADNRARIVDTIADYMGDFQIFLTTHDERFYIHLTHRLEGENWLFERITGYDFEKGPKRTSGNLRSAEINDLIAEGDPRIAGNAVRQFMEEWFDKICEKYEVYTLHKRDTREYQRTFYDFWQPFIGRVQKLGAGFRAYITDSAAYRKLKGSPLINYYSHYQANPYEWAAIGDVKYIWGVFQEFTKLFQCYSCSAQLRYDSSASKLYCTCGKPIRSNDLSDTYEVDDEHP